MISLKTQRLAPQLAVSKGKRAPRRWLRRLRMGLAVLLSVALTTVAWFWWTSPVPHPPQVVFPGVLYACERFDAADISGLAHLVAVDLTTPNLRIYETPLDPNALDEGWQYRTCWLPSAVNDHELAVAINGTMFGQDGPRWNVWPGRFARCYETIISNGQINQMDPLGYLLWFEADLTPHFERTRPPPAEAYRRAQFGISSRGLVIAQGKVTAAARDTPDARTLVGIDAKEKILFFAVLEHASTFRAAEFLAEYGATEAIILDGGSSTGLAFGQGARGISRSTIVYPKCAVANIFGVSFDSNTHRVPRN